MEEQIAEAIASRKLIRFTYAATSAPGVRTVEPHLLGDNLKGNAVLSAWFLSGNSASKEPPGWRGYLLDAIADLEVLDEEFAGARPGYVASGGKVFRNVRAAL